MEIDLDLPGESRETQVFVNLSIYVILKIYKRYCVYRLLVKIFDVVIIFFQQQTTKCSCKTTCSRKKTARNLGCTCRNINKHCDSSCDCGKGKLQCKYGKTQSMQRELAQKQPASAFDRHSAEVEQSVEEIKVRTINDNHNHFVICTSN